MSVPSSTKRYKDVFLHHLEKDEDHTGDFVRFVCDLENDIDRINVVYERLEKYGIIDEAFLEDRKVDDGLRDFYEKSGSACLQSGQYEKSLLSWTRMLMLAKSKKFLALGYAKRSEALFNLEMYEECITDIDRAFLHGFPHRLRPHLILRRKKSSDLLRTKTETKPYENPPTIPDHQKNPLSQYTTNSVEIRTGKTRKYIVAAKDIQIGEVISVEPPVLASVIKKGTPYYCHHCFELSYNPIPCDGCTKTIYCSETCKDNAFVNYHKNECPIVGSLIQLIATELDTVLPRRLLFSSPTEEDTHLIETIKSTTFTNFDKIYFRVIVTGAIVYGLVKKHTGRFQGPNSEKTEADFKNLIIRYIPFCLSQMLSIHARVFSKTLVLNRHIATSQTIACGMYPLTRTFRHSCCPNLHFYNYGMTAVTAATRTIKKGEECSIGYWVDYGFMEVEKRQRYLLSAYGFKCKCRACEENWPQYYFQSTIKHINFIKLFDSELVNYNLSSIRRNIRKAIKKVKQLENKEPSFEFWHESLKLIYYLSALGNKRLVL